MRSHNAGVRVAHPSLQSVHHCARRQNHEPQYNSAAAIRKLESSGITSDVMARGHITEERCLTSIPALRDMMRKAGPDDPSDTGHVAPTCALQPGWSKNSARFYALVPDCAEPIHKISKLSLD